MASSNLVISHMGLAGVNVDKNSLELSDNELTQAQNAVAFNASLRKRPGLVAFNTATITSGAVLGGMDLPLPDASASGSRSLFVGRGPTV